MHTEDFLKPDAAHLRVQCSPFAELLSVSYCEGKEIVEFDPPSGSRGEKRNLEMEESAFKRVAYPLMAGLGKSGWASAVLVLGPSIPRIFGWLFGLLPDVDLPSIPMPSYPDLPELPYIALPYPRWTMPNIHLPDMPKLPE